MFEDIMKVGSKPGISLNNNHWAAFKVKALGIVSLVEVTNMKAIWAETGLEVPLNAIIRPGEEIVLTGFSGEPGSFRIGNAGDDEAQVLVTRVRLLY